ncbi:MAG TPA: protein kinase [Pyrinomonadaceae bacterium]|nr:protein kinase [Pyrinomonadaceae bacterium]
MAPLSSGTKLGRYEIRSQLGAGGMGEVYRARDERLNRDVAIKVLPISFSADKDRLARFEQEAQAASALNHPNILVVYDVGTNDGAPYVVSELLEGETLRQRISGNPLAQRRAIDYALQIAHGLAAAHEKGIVHRDLKPDNIFITNDGRVKILDFGLAKLTQLDGDQAQTEIPTRRVNTDPGVVMGTVGYIAPEQLKGRTVDHRSDIFSFGAILYEMLSGRRAFHGESAAETMSAILKEDPSDLSDSNQKISPALERLVNHCLEKNPESRFHSASDLAFALEAISGSAPISSQTLTAMNASPASERIRMQLPWILTAVLALALIVALPFVFQYFRRAPVDKRVLKLSVLPPEKTTLTGVVSGLAVSPDGTRLAFIATSEGRNLLWLRSLNSVSAQALSGTEGAGAASPPFWSPDGRFIGFFAGGKLKKIDASGGPPQTLCDAAAGRGGTWNRDGLIVFGDASGVLYRVSAAGGEPKPVTALDRSRFESSHRWPYFLPDGRHFIYNVRSAQAESSGIYVGSLDSNETKRLLLPTALNAVFAPPGFLLFMRNKALLAQRFDADGFQLTGEPFPVAEQVAFNMGLGRAAFAASENGVLAFRTGGGDLNQPVWFDRGGKKIGSLGAPGLYFTLWLSPDERRAAVDLVDNQTGTNDVWLFDARGIPSRFTTHPAGDSNPLWSPDGSSVVFSSSREGLMNLYQKIESGVGNEELLLKSTEAKIADDWSSDGQFIAYQTFNPKTKWDLLMVPMSGDRQPFAFLQTEFSEHQAQFSPDAKWIAYTSDESGGPEVYVQTFPASGGKWRVSTGGGCQPRWRRDGRELFYIAADRKLMAVDVKLGSTFEAGVPKPLFGPLGVLTLTDFRNHYAVTADGQRFLINTTIEGADTTPITVVVNWTAELR